MSVQPCVGASVRRCVVGALLAVAPAGAAAAQNSAVHPSHPLEARAARRSGPITLDGRLDEADWRLSAPAGRFTQSQPNEGQAATQRTEVWFLFDDDALYIGARMYDSLGAEGVRTQLMRRDGYPSTDILDLYFDTFHDHVGRTEFAINPSGVKFDAYGPGGSNLDASWDAVWDAATAIDSLGWVAELRIPLSQLRFPRDSVQTWGVQIIRETSRLKERSHWAFWRTNEVGGPSRYGHLTGLELGGSRAKLEVMPYVVSRQARVQPSDPNDPFAQASEFDMRVGGDLRLPLASNLTLTATINPDFGQVEVDPAVVNLSAFETFFPERRPFFVEGSGLFSFGGLWCFFCSNASSMQMFYSRRVGRQPQGAGNAYAEGPYADVPENTAILGAAKLTGRIPGGWSLGILNALTAREMALVDTVGGHTRVEVEPLTNYFVGRVAKELRGGQTVVRGIATSVIRDLSDPALARQLPRHSEAFGLDVEHWWARRTYRLAVQAGYSGVHGDSMAMLRLQRSSARYFQRPDRGNDTGGPFTDAYDPSLTSLRGYATYVRLSKEGGNLLWELATNVRHPGFEVNDLSFLTQADYRWFNANIFPRWTRPTSWYRRLQFIAGGQARTNFDGDVTDAQGQVFFYIQPHNYWDISGFYFRRPEVYDDRLTRGGPTVRRPALDYWALNLFTDHRKRLQLGTSPYVSRTAEGAVSWYANVNATMRPATNVTVSFGPSFSRSRSRAQYVKAVTDPTATAFGGARYVFADLEQQQLALDTRVNWTFTPTLSLELFLQPLISSGDYSAYKEFVAPRGLAKQIYGQDVGTISSVTDTAGHRTYTVDPDGPGAAAAFSFADPNFNLRSLRGNLVVRWEYRPGSTLYFVWTQSRSETAPTGSFDLQRDMQALRSQPPDNIFMVKVSYWLGL